MRRPTEAEGNAVAVAHASAAVLRDIGAFEAHAPHVVDSMSVEADSNPNDGRCLTAGAACTLRAAVQQANATPGLEEIELPAGTFPLTLLGPGEDLAATGDLDLLHPVIVRGAGAGETVIEADGDRVFDLRPPATPGRFAGPRQHILRGLTIANGQAGAGGGGGIRINDRVLRLERAVLSDNRSETAGGALRCESGCELAVIDSRLVGNSASSGGGIAAPGEAGRVLVERSELSGNAATVDGGAALAVVDLTLRNSTVSGNRAQGSGADAAGAVIMTFGVVESSTIADNSAANAAGGIRLELTGAARNSLVAGNVNGAGESRNCAFASAAGMASFSAGRNLSDTEAADCSLAHPTDLPSTDPLLGPLAGNGGLTQTHALLRDSPAIDAGDDANCPRTDQRGFFRSSPRMRGRQAAASQGAPSNANWAACRRQRA